MEAARQSAFDQAYRKTLMLYSGLITVVPILFVVAYLVADDSGDPVVTDPFMLWAFRAVAVAAFLISFPVSGRLRNAGAKVSAGSTSGKRHGTTGADALIQNMTTYAIVPYAICEVALLLGFVLFVLYGSWGSFTLLALLTVAGWAAHFPRSAAWADLVEQAEVQDAGFDPIVS